MASAIDDCPVRVLVSLKRDWRSPLENDTLSSSQQQVPPARKENAIGRSLKTTNILESVNSQAEERCGRVDHWQNSKQKQRWLAAALLDIEPRLRRLVGYRHLPTLQAAIMKELKLGGAEERSKRAT